LENEIIIRIKEDETVKVEVSENGTITHKNISPDTLIQCIQGSIEQNVIKSGLLPSGTLSVAIDSSNESKYIVMEFPDDHADMAYMDTVYERFPIPRLLFGFAVQESGRISKVNLGVPADEKLTMDTKMYKYPFSNVSHFTMCTGSNSLPDVKKGLWQLTNLPYHIMRLPDNDDHFMDSHNRFSMSRRDLMEHLRDKDRNYYYEHVLVPMPNTTLKDFM